MTNLASPSPLLTPLSNYQAAQTQLLTKTLGTPPSAPTSAPTSPTASPTSKPSTPIKPGTSFRDALNAAAAPKPHTVKEDSEQDHKVAGDLIANALVLPVLKQLRHDTFSKNNIFSGGIGENTFGPQFDMQIADRIAHSSKMTATNNLADRILSKQHPEIRAATMQAKSASTQPGSQGASQKTATQKFGVDVHG